VPPDHLGGDRPGSSIRHNTIVGTGPRLIDCAGNPGFDPSLTSIRDNIADEILLIGATNCTPSADECSATPAARTSPASPGSWAVPPHHLRGLQARPGFTRQRPRERRPRRRCRLSDAM